MDLKVLNQFKESTTKEEFEEILDIATQDIKFNNISFRRLTKAEDLKVLLDRGLVLVRGVQAYESIN